MGGTVNDPPTPTGIIRAAMSSAGAWAGARHNPASPAAMTSWPPMIGTPGPKRAAVRAAAGFSAATRPVMGRKSRPVASGDSPHSYWKYRPCRNTVP